MAMGVSTAKLLAFLALFLLPAVAAARVFHVHAHPLRPATRFTVQGRVFCDTCLAGFETSASTYIHGARLRVECKDDDTLDVIYKVEGVTDETGTYKIAVEGDHDGQLCEAVLVSSPMSECATVEQGRGRARVDLTSNNGIASSLRYANNLSFLRDSPLAGCAQLLKQYQDSESGKERQG